jgi:hypothetical protein
VQADPQCQRRRSGSSRYSGLPFTTPSLQKEEMNIQLSSKFRQHLPYTVRCQNLQLNIRHEGRQPDICILIELNEALPIHIHIANSTSHSTTSHFQQVITTSHIHMSAHLAWADNNSVGGTWMNDDSGAVRALALCFSSPFSILPLLLSLSPLSPFPPPPTPLLLSLPSFLRQGRGAGGGGRQGHTV